MTKEGQHAHIFSIYFQGGWWGIYSRGRLNLLPYWSKKSNHQLHVFSGKALNANHCVHPKAGTFHLWNFRTDFCNICSQRCLTKFEGCRTIFLRGMWPSDVKHRTRRKENCGFVRREIWAFLALSTPDNKSDPQRKSCRNQSFATPQMKTLVIVLVVGAKQASEPWKPSQKSWGTNVFFTDTVTRDGFVEEKRERFRKLLWIVRSADFSRTDEPCVFSLQQDGSPRSTRARNLIGYAPLWKRR